jgi:hypothetical protein
MIDYVRLLNGAYGAGSHRLPPQALPIRDLATEIKRLTEIILVQKGELERLRRILNERLLP